MEHEPPDLNLPLSDEQLAYVAQLSREQVEAIDNALSSQCAASWRKVSYVVGSAIQQLQLPGILDAFFALRVREHVALGKLEGRGDLTRMRYSEVRVPVTHSANAT